jgi:hypothetical protein
MEQDTEFTPVIFRKMQKGYGGDVLAVFPTDAATYNAYECGCYAHVGQHGACEPGHVIARSRPAKPEEYKDLMAELQGAPYGYRLKVYKRMQWDLWRRERELQLRQDKEHSAEAPAPSAR